MTKLLQHLYMHLFFWAGSKLFNNVAVGHNPHDPDDVDAIVFAVSEEVLDLYITRAEYRRAAKAESPKI